MPFVRSEVMKYVQECQVYTSNIANAFYPLRQHRNHLQDEPSMCMNFPSEISFIVETSAQLTTTLYAEVLKTALLPVSCLVINAHTALPDLARTNKRFSSSTNAQ